MLFSFEQFVLDTERRELRGPAGPISLEPQVFDFLVYLIRNRDRVVSKDDIITAIWSGRVVSESVLTTRLNAARSAIGDSGAVQRLIKTCREKACASSATCEIEQAFAIASFAEQRKVPLTVLELPDRPSIVVLPFINMSSDPDQEYFADGMVEDIITALSRFRSLFVIARNSSFEYKHQSVNIKHVCRNLGVRYVLEGSVRKSATVSG